MCLYIPVASGDSVPLLLLERPLEDHECVVDVYTHWAGNTSNQFMFKLMEDKYEIFEDPTVSVVAQTMGGGGTIPTNLWSVV